MHTLMIHTGGIGDFLLTCPTINALSQLDDIHLAGHPDRLQLAVNAGIASSAQSLDNIGFDSVFTQTNKRLIQALSQTDKIIVWMKDSDQSIQKSLKAISSAKILIFDPLPPKDFIHHASEYYAQCLGLPLQPPFRWSPRTVSKHFDIVIHPGSGDPKKNWPLEYFEDLAAQLESTGRKVTWCIGPAEAERMPRFPNGPLIQSTTLTELAEVLATAQQYIGNDSGITHLAASLGLPTIVLFDHTDPSIWAPQGENVTVLHQANDPAELILNHLHTEL